MESQSLDCLAEASDEAVALIVQDARPTRRKSSYAMKTLALVVTLFLLYFILRLVNPNM